MPFVTKSTRLISRLEECVCASIAEETGKFHARTGITRFVIGGSHASLRVTDTYAERKGIEDYGDMEVVPLVSNDIDVSYGEFARDKTKKLFVDKCSIKNFSIKGVAAEVNTIECRNLVPETFLENNNIDIMASCILVYFLSGEMKASLCASSCFWIFLFHYHSDRKIQPVNTINTDEYEANACIRIIYNSGWD